MPLSKFISLLTFEARWFSKLNILQDQYEGKMPVPTKQMMDERHHAMKEDFPLDLHWQFDEMASRNEDDSRELLVTNCWFLGESESQKMWQEYGCGADAVAIKSKVRKLFHNLSVPHDKHATNMGRVKYIEHDKYLMSAYEANQGIELAFLKDAKTYQHEKELRIVTLNTQTKYCVKPDGEPYGGSEVQGKKRKKFE